MDSVKRAIANAVQQHINDAAFVTSVMDKLPLDVQNAYNIEVFDTEPLLTQVKLYTDHGPRYFTIKVSEMM